jgi:trk system potassium uptake protein
MPKKKHYYVLGLGTFGSALAKRLTENGCRVTGVDANEQRVDLLKDILYEAVIADVSERRTLAELNIGEADAVFISLGEHRDLTPSILAVLHGRELGAKRIFVKGLSSDHAKILKTLGVERVIFPETEIAIEVADRITWPNVLDYMPIDPDYSFVEMAVPDSLVGRSLQEADLRRLFNIWVIGIKDALTGRLELFPDPTFRFGADQLMVVVATHRDLNRLREVK